MLGHRHVVNTRDDQTKLAWMVLLERDEVLKQLTAAFIRIDAARVEKIRRGHRLRLAKFCINRHRNDSSRQVAPEFLSDTLFGSSQPDKRARPSRGVFVCRKIGGQ